MVHNSQTLVNIIHLLAVSEESTHWFTPVMQPRQSGGGVTPTRTTLAFLEYLFFAAGVRIRVKRIKPGLLPGGDDFYSFPWHPMPLKQLVSQICPEYMYCDWLKSTLIENGYLSFDCLCTVNAWWAYWWVQYLIEYTRKPMRWSARDTSQSGYK